jgi:PKD repeat protein
MNKTTIKNKIISTIAKRFLATTILALGLTANANAQALCQAAFTYTNGASGLVNFTNASTGTTTTTIYYWTFGDNTSSNVVSPNHTYTYNGGYRVWLTIDSSGGGCSSSVTDSVTITNGINCTLAAAYTYTAGASGSVNFTDASTGVDPGMVYSWTWYGGTSSGSSALQSPTINFIYNGTYYVTMNVGDPTQTCSKSVTDTIVVTNGQPCQTTFTYTVNAGGVVNFTNTSQGNSSYYWDFGDGSTSTQVSPSHTYAYNGGYHVSLTSDTSGGACGGYIMDSITVTTTSNAPTCSANFAYMLLTGGQVAFTNTSTTSLANPVYNWSFGDGQTSTLNNPSNTYVYNGSYNVTLNILDSMANNICSYNTTVNITNAAGGGCHDTVSFVMNKDTAAFGAWDVYLTNNSVNSPVSATWYWGDGSSDNALYPTHTYAAPGWYTICVWAKFACGDSSYYCLSDSLYRSSSIVSVTVVNTTAGIKTITSNLAAVKIYPNPFTDNLTIDLNSATGSAVTYSIYTMYGEQVATEKISLNKGENKIGINTSAISSGMYFVTITDSNKKMQTFKVVK